MKSNEIVPFTKQTIDQFMIFRKQQTSITEIHLFFLPWVQKELYQRVCFRSSSCNELFELNVIFTFQVEHVTIKMSITYKAFKTGSSDKNSGTVPVKLLFDKSLQGR